jgi:hypothetical protein
MPFDCARLEIVEEDRPPGDIERARAVAKRSALALR